MRILYLLSIILLIFMFLKFKKVKQNQNIILWILLSILLFLCFNSLSIFILSIFHIKAYLFIRFIINLLSSIFIYYFLIRGKEKQSYFFESRDLIVLFILLVFTIIIGYLRFGSTPSLNFETTDPAVHYLNGKIFYDENTLTGNTDIINIYGSLKNQSSMFFSYTNLGTMMQLMDNIYSYTDLYKVFILFELIVFFLSAYLFYFTIKENNKKEKILFPIIISIIYILGYPLNNLLFGFHYLGLGVLLTNLLILLVTMFYKEDINKTTFKIIISMVALSIFFTYYLFIPVVYASVGFYILYQCFFEKKINFKTAILDIIYLLVIPFVIGMFYFFVLPKILGIEAVDTGTALATEGYIYRNLAGNFIFFAPIILYEIIDFIKSKKIKIELICFIVTGLCILLLFDLVLKNIASTYYFYKFYYLIALFIFLIIGKNVNDKERSLFSISVIIIYGIIMLIMCSNIEESMNERNNLLNPTCFSKDLTDVYSFNKFMMSDRTPILDQGDIEIIDYINNHKDLVNDKGEILVVGDLFEKLWMYSIIEVNPNYEYKMLGDFYLENLTKEEIEEKNIDKFIIFNNDEKYEFGEEYEIIFENSSGTIYKKK